MTDDLGTPCLRLEREGPIVWCVIDRPGARNVLTPAMYYGIKRAVRLVNTDPDLAALVITGTGDALPPVATSAVVPKARRRYRRREGPMSSRSWPSGTARHRSSRRSTGSARPGAC